MSVDNVRAMIGNNMLRNRKKVHSKLKEYYIFTINGDEIKYIVKKEINFILLFQGKEQSSFT
jgi:hypothetical protein